MTSQIFKFPVLLEKSRLCSLLLHTVMLTSGNLLISECMFKHTVAKLKVEFSLVFEKDKKRTSEKE